MIEKMTLMKDDLGLGFIIPTVILTLAIIIDFIGLFRYKRMLRNTYKKIKVDNFSRFLPKTDLLLQRYKLVPKKNLKLIKLELEANEYSNNLISQTLDFFHKLIITITIAGVTVMITISVATLSFLKDNALLQEDKPAWIKNVQANLNNFSNGLNFYIQLVLVALVLFVVFSLHSHVLDSKNKNKKKHLRYIEEALKDD